MAPASRWDPHRHHELANTLSELNKHLTLAQRQLLALTQHVSEHISQQQSESLRDRVLNAVTDTVLRAAARQRADRRARKLDLDPG